MRLFNRREIPMRVREAPVHSVCIKFDQLLGQGKGQFLAKKLRSRWLLFEMLIQGSLSPSGLSLVSILY